MSIKRLLQVFDGGALSPPPFWFMRQAGRYMPEYRALRAEAGSFLKLCLNPEYAAEVTMQPVRKFGMDAAILFADILLVPMALGIPLEFAEGEGPKLGQLAVGSWRFDEGKLQPVYDTLKILNRGLSSSPTTLIGFAGSPWTVATYIVEGGSSREFTKTKAMMRGDAAGFQKIIDALVDATSRYLISQIESGAEVLQIFDSWAGALQGDEFKRWVIEPNARIIQNVKVRFPNVPIIGFPRMALPDDLKKFVAATGVDGLSIDSTTPLEWAFENLDCVIQGNLDPQILLGEKAGIKSAAEKILKTAQGKPFIFNLGHGIIKETPVENVEFLCEVIKKF